MNTMITKVASIDILSSAMEELYQNQMQKRAEENFYQSAVKKIKDSAASGYSVAQDILEALNGRYPHGKKPFDLTDPMLGLKQEEAFALGGTLESSSSTGAHGDDLLRAMKQTVSEIDDSEKAADNNRNFDDTRGDLAGNTNVSLEMPDYIEAEGPTGNNPTETGHTGQQLSDDAKNNYERRMREQHPGPIDVKPATGPDYVPAPGPKTSLNHLQLLNTIEKIANVLGANGFEMSEMVADQLISTFIKESK